MPEANDRTGREPVSGLLQLGKARVLCVPERLRVHLHAGPPRQPNTNDAGTCLSFVPAYSVCAPVSCTMHTSIIGICINCHRGCACSDVHLQASRVRRQDAKAGRVQEECKEGRRQGRSSSPGQSGGGLNVNAHKFCMPSSELLLLLLNAYIYS